MNNTASDDIDILLEHNCFPKKKADREAGGYSSILFHFPIFGGLNRNFGSHCCFTNSPPISRKQPTHSSMLVRSPTNNSHQRQLSGSPCYDNVDVGPTDLGNSLELEHVPMPSSSRYKNVIFMNGSSACHKKMPLIPQNSGKTHLFFTNQDLTPQPQEVKVLQLSYEFVVWAGWDG